MHVVIVDTERCKAITLCCWILSRGRDRGVSDGNAGAAAFRPRPSVTGHLCGTGRREYAGQAPRALNGPNAVAKSVPMNDRPSDGHHQALDVGPNTSSAG